MDIWNLEEAVTKWLHISPLPLLWLLFPFFPGVWLVANGGLFAVSYNGSFQDLGIFYEVDVFGVFAYVLDEREGGFVFGIGIDEVIDAADGLFDAP